MTNDFLFFYKETKKYIHTAREMTFCPNLFISILISIFVGN